VTPLFSVQIPQFEGPIDLLLHLVKLNELPIEKLSLAQIASQYFACLEEMRGYDLDIAGEYLVIAATLLSIKSSVLLQEPVELVIDDEGNLVDPHEELLRRLREAAVYHEAARVFGETPMLGHEVFVKEGVMHLSTSEAPLMKHSLDILERAFVKVIKRARELGRTLTFSFDPVSILDRMMMIVSKVKETGTQVFSRLISDKQSKAEIVGTFVAILELAKRGAVSISQEGALEEIVVSQGEVVYKEVANL